MVVINEISAQAEPVGKAVLTKPIPSYMQPTKTSARKQQAVVPKSKTLKPKDRNLVQTISNGSQARKSGTKVPATKQDKPAKLKALAMIKSGPKVQFKTKKRGLGNLFTDGGLEEILIKVVSFLENNELAPCLRVCKNSNAVMVKTSEIQVCLRAHLYGIRMLFCPRDRQLKALGDLQSKHSSKPILSALINMQRRVELDTYTPYAPTLGSPRTLTPQTKLLDMQNGTRLLEIDGICTLDDGNSQTRIAAHFLGLSSSFTWCIQDAVILEARGHPQLSSLGERVVDIKINWTTTTKEHDPTTITAKHPDARTFLISLVMPGYEFATRGLDDITVRLYPGGLAAILLGGSSTRIVVSSWHHATALGVIRVPFSTTMISDVQFLSDSRIVCSSYRIIDGWTFPCIDIYDLPNVTVPDLAVPVDNWCATIDSARMSSIPHIASFRLPRWRCINMAYIWSLPETGSYEISDFALKLPRPSKAASVRDQVMTFRIEGRSEGKGRKCVHGAVLVSQLDAVLQEAAAKRILELAVLAGGQRIKGKHKRRAQSATLIESGSPVAPRQLDNKAMVIDWKQWDHAVSVHHSASSTVLEPKGTQVADIVQSPTNEGRAVMVIRDYNQQMLSAPLGNMNRLLGHPTDNDPLDPSGTKLILAETFKPAPRKQWFSSSMFLGSTVYHGLGHRKRTIELGSLGPDPALSRMFWDAPNHVAVVDQPPGGSGRLYIYRRHLARRSQPDKNPFDDITID